LLLHCTAFLAKQDILSKRSLCQFYTPKVVFIFLYFLITLTMYSVIVFRQQENPLYDWSVRFPRHRSTPCRHCATELHVAPDACDSKAERVHGVVSKWCVCVSVCVHV
jgi:hypothetical protein